MAKIKTYSVSEKFVKQAHNAACSEWKTKIEQQFPEAFKPVPFVFDAPNHTITRNAQYTESPLFIGFGMAPDGYENRCLIVNSTYVMRVVEAPGGNQCLIFERKS